MATGGKEKAAYSLVNVGDLRLEDTNEYRYYRGIVACRDKIIVIDWYPNQVRLHRLQDGKLLFTHRLESRPRAICVINDMEIAVILDDGQIQIMAVESRDNMATITSTRNLRVQGGFDRYDGVVKFKENLVVCGVKQETMCWCVASLNDGRVDTIHQICKVSKYDNYSYLTTKGNMIYISCCAGRDSPDSGVYGFDILNPSQPKYTYKHKDLSRPGHIAINQDGFIFVCNYSRHGFDSCIHQLTSNCQLVSIYRPQGIPRNLSAIFWDHTHGHLYVTCDVSNVISIFQPEYPDPAIPAEVLTMDTRSLRMYKEALRGGKEKVYNIRVMVVGQYGVGKTTLIKRLLGKDVNISKRESTEGIDMHIECSKVSLASGEWTAQEKNAEQYFRLQRLVKLLNEHVQKQEASSEQEGQGGMDNPSASKEHKNEHHAITSISKTIDQPVQSKTSIKKSNILPPSQQTQPSSVKIDERRVAHAGQKSGNISTSSGDAVSNKSDKKDALIEILQLVNKSTDKLEKNIEEYASLAMWDFAGQYVFYTTHQTFLTSHAIYLLVIDLGQQVTDLVNDECFLDTEGIKQCKVHDLIDIWLNSIHSCAPSTDSGIPSVILVGTHVDKITEKSRQKVIDEYYRKIRQMLKDKPTILHLMGYVAIDNTKSDPKLTELKKMIFKLASQHPRWGEEKPARWLPLEQAIMTLKASGAKVVPLSLVEEINRSGSVRIEDKGELDLFLRYQHEMGTILYFSVEELREKIVLDPQWLIDALKSLITAEMFIINYPAIVSKWFEFKEKGKLTQELLDAIWTKKERPELHDNKEHVLLLMERLNIIARPKAYTKDGKEIKEENYYLAPCMLRQATPREIISPEAHPQKESTSVLCFTSAEKFLPPPVFHRLIGACLTHWPIAQQASENLIYCGCCVFDLDLNHRLTLHLIDYVIFARVTRMAVTDMSQSSKLCIEARKFILENLSKIIGNLGKSLKFELRVQCPNSYADSLQSLIAVSLLQKNEKVPCHSHKESHTLVSRNLLKFWFDEEGSQGNKGGDTGKLHRNVLNRCQPALVRDLDFQSVSMYIQEKELFDDVTMRDISEQKTTSDKIRELVKRIQQRDEDTYVKFKECLVQAKQAFLKDMLEKEEAKEDKQCTVS